MATPQEMFKRGEARNIAAIRARGKPPEPDPLEEEQEFIRAGKARARTAANRLAQLRGESVGRMEQDIEGLSQVQEGGRAAIRQQAAKALAAGLSGGTPITSGANLAAAQQSALDVGSAIGEYDVGAQQALMAARGRLSDEETLAQQAELAAAQLSAEAGTETQDRTQALAQAQADVNQAIKDNERWYGDDEEAMNREIRQIAARQTNPQVRDWVLSQIGAGQAEGGWWNSLTGL